MKSESLRGARSATRQSLPKPPEPNVRPSHLNFLTFHPKTQALARQSVSVGGQVLIFLIHTYRLPLSAFLGRHCRFHPTCSAYAIASIEKHGLLRGAWRAARRVARCHPLSPGGFDPP